MQTSAKPRPASKPPAAFAPQSITRVPFASVVTCTRTASASAASRSASSRARSLSESMSVLQDQDLTAPQLETVAAPARVASRDLLVGHGQAERTQAAQVQGQERRGGGAGGNQGREGGRRR